MVACGEVDFLVIGADQSIWRGAGWYFKHLPSVALHGRVAQVFVEKSISFVDRPFCFEAMVIMLGADKEARIVVRVIEPIVEELFDLVFFSFGEQIGGLLHDVEGIQIDLMGWAFSPLKRFTSPQDALICILKTIQMGMWMLAP